MRHLLPFVVLAACLPALPDDPKDGAADSEESGEEVATAEGEVTCEVDGTNLSVRGQVDATAIIEKISVTIDASAAVWEDYPDVTTYFLNAVVDGTPYADGAQRTAATWVRLAGKVDADVLESCSFAIEPPCPDADGDGQVDEACGGTDCDDTNDTVSTAATEDCETAADDNCDGELDALDASGCSAWWADADGDGFGDATVDSECWCAAPAGFVADSADCDDNSASVSPAGTETCNDADDDCDGSVDDDAADATTWYGDADGDGYGGTVTMQSCAQPAGYVADSTDCDDAGGTVNPAAVETCDGVDTNCSGDEDDAVDPSSWYADGDGDGFGSGATAVAACEAPLGYVADAGDCEDTDATFNPAATDDCADPADYDCDGVTAYADADADGVAACEDCDDGDGAVFPGAVEVCDGVDGDCDGNIDDGAVDAGSWYVDADADGYGDPATPVSACSAPAGTVADGDDCDDADPAVSPGESEVCGNGVDDDCDGGPGSCALSLPTSLASADATLTGEGTGDRAGAAVVCGDLDDDGAVDVAVGADEEASEDYLAGAAYVVRGPLSLTLDLGAADMSFSAAGGGNIGSSFAAGDFDGDGALDLAVGARRYSGGRGAAYVFAGPLASLGSTVATVTGGAAWDSLGRRLAAADPDGDGIADLAVGADSADPGGTESGAVYLFEGTSMSGSLADSAADATYAGAAANLGVGGGALALADIDGDGLGDLVTGGGLDSYGETSNSAWLWYGPHASRDTGAADVTWTGATAGDKAGFAAAAGDVDGDGYADVLLGAYGRDAESGAMYVMSGATASSGVTSAVAVATLEGVVAGDRAGFAVTLGDVDASGELDVVVGAPYASGGGTVYVLLGPVAGGTSSLSAADAALSAGSSDAVAGFSLAACDVQGDVADDLVIGGPGYSAAGTNAGGVWLAEGTLGW